MKYLYLIVCILIATSVVLYSKVDDLKKTNKTLQEEKKALIEDIKRRDKNDLEVYKSTKENEKLSKQDKTSFDWNYNLNNSPVVIRLRSECRSCAKAN